MTRGWGCTVGRLKVQTSWSRLSRRPALSRLRTSPQLATSAASTKAITFPPHGAPAHRWEPLPVPRSPPDPENVEARPQTCLTLNQTALSCRTAGLVPLPLVMPTPLTRLLRAPTCYCGGFKQHWRGNAGMLELQVSEEGAMWWGQECAKANGRWELGTVADWMPKCVGTESFSSSEAWVLQIPVPMLKAKPSPEVQMTNRMGGADKT